MTEARRSPLPQYKGTRAYALASVLCGLIYPITVLVAFVGRLARTSGHLGTSGNPLLAAISTVFLYFEWPAAVLALTFGHAARARANPGRRLAMVGLALGYLSAAMILGAALWIFVATPR